MKPVLIVGSGIGGLTLAHGMRSAGIPYRIYERDPSHSSRAQGYRIRIHGPALDYLEKVLPAPVYKRFIHTCGRSVPGRIGPGMGRLDAFTGEKITGMINTVGGPAAGAGRGGSGPGPGQGPGGGGGPGGPPGGLRSSPVDRQTMRSCLLQDLSPPEYSKALISYTVTPTGVTSTFVDGTTSEEGSLLVGADGIYSKVAKQLFGETDPLDTKGRMIFGKTPLSSGLIEGMHPELQKGGMSIVQAKDDSGRDIMLFMETMNFDHPDTPEDYIYWVLLGDAETFGEDDDRLVGMDNTAAANLARGVSSKWLPSIRIVIEHQAVENTALLRMTTANPEALPVWTTDPRVTLLGDAIHCMPPTGGSGANTAIRDAVLLSDKLSEGFEQAKHDDGWSKKVVGEYESEMRDYAGQMVMASYKAAVNSFGVKPMEGFSVN